MESKVIHLNSWRGKEDEIKHDVKAYVNKKLQNTKIQFDRAYNTEKKIEDMIGYNRKEDESIVGWSMVGISFIYIYGIATLLGAYNTLFLLLLVILGEVYIFKSSDKLYNIVKNIKLSNSLNKISDDNKKILKSLINERKKIRRFIGIRSNIDVKYLDKYIVDEDLREHLFNFMSDYMLKENIADFNKSAEYSLKKIKSINLGFKKEFNF